MRRIFPLALLTGLVFGTVVDPNQNVEAKGLTPFEVAATIDCTGTIAWSVTVGAEFGQVIKIDAIENGVVVGLGLELVPDAGTYTGARSGFETGVLHLVRFQRLNEGLIQEQVSLFAADTCGLEPVPADATPPQVAAAIAGTLGSLDWYVTDIHIDFTVADLESTPSAVGCEPSVVSADTAGLTRTCTATSAGGERSVSVTVKRDGTPPTITCVTGAPTFLVGQLDVVVDATVTDATSGPTTALLSSDVDTTTPGARSVSFTTTDLAGNVSTTVCEYVVVEPEVGDLTPPAVTATVVGTSGTNDWFTSDVEVSWSIDDPDSATQIDAGCVDVVIVEDTTGSVQSCAVTSAGGTTTSSVVVKRDATAPTVTCALRQRFSVEQSGSVVTATVADDTSGPTNATISAEVDTATPGVHRVTLTGTDLAGNTTQQSCEYRVRRGRPHPNTGRGHSASAQSTTTVDPTIDGSMTTRGKIYANPKSC